MTNKFYSGFVSIIGKPNVGKSTLINNLINEKIAIVSSKPQTTRNKITCILTKEDYQIVFIDTPGFHEAKNKLGNYMVNSAKNAIYDVDAILYLVEPVERVSQIDKNIIKILEGMSTPVILLINKVDKVKKEEILSIIEMYKNLYDFKDIIPISAANGTNVDSILNVLRNDVLEEGPKYFPEDMITDQPERQIVSEIVREKILRLMREEIPHGVAIEIMSMKERKDKAIMDIDVNIYCEKKSHKGMVIGKNGAMLKEVGIKSRIDIEKFLGQKVNLKLWVKVKEDWRDSDFLLKNFGFDSKKI